MEGEVGGDKKPKKEAVGSTSRMVKYGGGGGLRREAVSERLGNDARGRRKSG